MSIDMLNSEIRAINAINTLQYDTSIKMQSKADIPTLMKSPSMYQTILFKVMRSK